MQSKNSAAYGGGEKLGFLVHEAKRSFSERDSGTRYVVTEATMGLKERVENNPVVWFLGAIITGFVAGIAAYQGVLQMAKLEVVSGERLAQHDMLLTKDRFLSLYLRYALMNLPPGYLEHTDEDKAAAREQLDEYIIEYIDEADKSESLVRVGKGQGRQAILTFPDGSTWTVPPTFRAPTGD